MEREKIQAVQNFINVLDGKEINISAAPTKIENGDIYWDYENESKPLDLYCMSEDELNGLKDELSPYVLNYLKEEYLNKEIRLITLDSKMCKLCSLPESKSIFNYNTREMLEESFGYCYNDMPDGFNFYFKIVEDNTDITEIVVKVTNIDTI